MRGRPQEDEGPEFLDVIDGRPCTLGDGESVQVITRPNSGMVQEQGVLQKVVPFFDYTYGTRDPILHVAHVGVDGFSVAPTDVFDGEDDLGVDDGESRVYSLPNRWTIPQNLTVDAEDVNDPGQWPPGLVLRNHTSAFSVELPPKNQPPFRIPALIDGTGVEPGTYTGRIYFRSDDSGSPPFEITRDVYLDHCREVFEHPMLPEQNLEIPRGDEDTWTLEVTPTGGTSISDVDVIAEVIPLIGSDEPLVEIFLRSPPPGNVEVQLKREDTGFQDVYDEETGRPAFGDLNDFNNSASSGPWLLRIVHSEDSPVPLFTYNFERFHVRLHHFFAPPCL